MYDLFVIGAGSGGVRSARLAAAQGFSVGIAESSRVGGTCVIRGCVPKKLLMYGSNFYDSLSKASGYGISFENKLIGSKESHRLVLKTKEPPTTMGKIIGKL